MLSLSWRYIPIYSMKVFQVCVSFNLTQRYSNTSEIIYIFIKFILRTDSINQCDFSFTDLDTCIRQNENNSFHYSNACTYFRIFMDLNSVLFKHTHTQSFLNYSDIYKQKTGGTYVANDMKRADKVFIPIYWYFTYFDKFLRFVYLLRLSSSSSWEEPSDSISTHQKYTKAYNETSLSVGDQFYT